MCENTPEPSCEEKLGQRSQAKDYALKTGIALEGRVYSLITASRQLLACAKKNVCFVLEACELECSSCSARGQTTRFGYKFEARNPVPNPEG